MIRDSGLLFWGCPVYTVLSGSGTDCMGHEGARANTFTNGWARGIREYRRTANKELTKLY